MTRLIRFHPEAEAEMNEAADYLNRESTGLGKIFLDDIQHAKGGSVVRLLSLAGMEDGDSDDLFILVANDDVIVGELAVGEENPSVQYRPYLLPSIQRVDPPGQEGGDNKPILLQFIIHNNEKFSRTHFSHGHESAMVSFINP
jgi:hypothetical protein